MVASFTEVFVQNIPEFVNTGVASDSVPAYCAIKSIIDTHRYAYYIIFYFLPVLPMFVVTTVFFLFSLFPSVFLSWNSKFQIEYEV